MADSPVSVGSGSGNIRPPWTYHEASDETQSLATGRPAWAYHWPRSKVKESPCCGLCGETDLFKIHYYVVGFRCERCKP